ncbi:MAG: DNA-directed RNA polymerase [Candidatus Aenigmarchaeota archaeon]|nr:DNA-directed RNA polymerase [Candidatus Aenigmarchaeota archaeon]
MAFGDRRGGGGFDRGPREMHKTVCSDCQKECEVPFKPVEGREVWCRDCLPKHKQSRRF